MISLVVAVSQNGIIGRDGKLPWRLSSDLKQFKAVTMGKPIIMGRRTWESLPRKPLPGRLNIVVTRSADFAPPGALVATSAEMAIDAARQDPSQLSSGEICVIGGGQIYNLFLPLADRIYLTEVHLVIEGDARFPDLNPLEWEEASRHTFTKGERDDADFTLRVLNRVKPASSLLAGRS